MKVSWLLTLAVPWTTGCLMYMAAGLDLLLICDAPKSYVVERTREHSSHRLRPHGQGETAEWQLGINEQYMF